MVSLLSTSINGALLVFIDNDQVKAENVAHAVDLLNRTNKPFALMRTGRGDQAVAVTHIVSIKEDRPAQIMPKPPGM